MKTRATQISVPSVSIAIEPMGTMAPKWLHGILFLLAVAYVYADRVECHGQPERQVSWLVMPEGVAKLDRSKVQWQGTSDGNGHCTFGNEFTKKQLFFIHTCGLPDTIAERCFVITRSYDMGKKDTSPEFPGQHYFFELAKVKPGHSEIVCDNQQKQYMV